MFLLCASPVHPFRYSIKHYYNADGLPQSQVLAIFQDRQGYLWIGTYCGISRYDGERFLTLTTHQGLPSNYVYDIDQDENGVIYVATDGGVCKISSELRVQTLSSPVGTQSVWRLILLKSGKFIYHDPGGYHHWDGKTSTLLLPCSRGQVLRRPLREGNVIYLPTERGLFSCTDGEVTRLTGPDSPDVYTVTVREGVPYIGTDRGVFRVENERLKQVVKCGLAQTLLNHKGSIWVGTEEGLYHHYHTGTRKITREHGLSNNTILSLLFDREGTVWIGTNLGLNKLPYRFFKSFSTEDGLPSNYIWCVYGDPELGLLVGGEKGIARLQGERFEPLSLPGLDLENGYVRSLLRSSDGTLWVGTFRNGCYRYQNGEMNHHKKIGDANIRHVFSMTEDLSGSVWLATSNGVLRYREGRFTRFGLTEGLPDLTVWHIVLDPEHRILVATDDGLAVWRDNRFEIPEFVKTLNLQTVRNITFDSEGTMWIGTNGDGIYTWDGNRLGRYRQADGFVDDFIWGVVHKKPGETWIGTNRGLVRMEKETTVVFNKADGLPGDEMTLNSSYRDHKGRLWFGVLPGLIQVNPDMFDDNPCPPLVRVSRVVTNVRTVTHPSSMVFEPGEEEITFFMDGLSFQDEKEVHFSYRLRGYDSWSVPGVNRSVRYTNIPPGQYTFEVKACNNFGVWNEKPIRLSMIVKPIWYETWGFRMTALFVFLLLVFGFVRTRLAASDRSKRYLEHLVAERTRELYQASITDPLLSIYNRRYMDKMMTQKIGEALRHNDGLCLALIDLDQFKETNDRYGHYIGDIILQQIAQTLKSLIRASDALARYGGDEFIVAFFRTDEQQMDGRLSRIVQTIAETRCDVDGVSVTMTASIGAVCHRFHGDSDVSYDDLLKAADRALYDAKASGKNRYVKYHL